MFHGILASSSSRRAYYSSTTTGLCVRCERFLISSRCSSGSSYFFKVSPKPAVSIFFLSSPQVSIIFRQATTERCQTTTNTPDMEDDFAVIRSALALPRPPGLIKSPSLHKAGVLKTGRLPQESSIFSLKGRESEGKVLPCQKSAFRHSLGCTG